MQLFEYGMVVASSDGMLNFFDINEEGQFVDEPIRNWKYKFDDYSEENPPTDVIRGIKVLDTDRFKMLSVQLSNRNVILIDMFKEVYQ